MPMSAAFQNRLYPVLSEIVQKFGTPFHIYDETGIRQTAEELTNAFALFEGFREFYAVKALPNPRILQIMGEMGFGFDCSSIAELMLSRRFGARGGDIMFTSNNTSVEEFSFAAFKARNGYVPKLFMESGRYMTGPHGVLVATAINHKDTYRKYIGVDACMSALMRPAMYGAYHHITVPRMKGIPETMTADVVGSLCENNDKFAILRRLPRIADGDILCIHDTGAHGHAMGFNYNGRLRPKELLLRADGMVELIRREETAADHFATLEFDAKVLEPANMHRGVLKN